MIITMGLIPTESVERGLAQGRGCVARALLSAITIQTGGFSLPGGVFVAGSSRI